MEKSITKIKANTGLLPKKKRTAAYARVSSGKDAMLHSLSAQISYYSDLIQKRPDLEYVGVFADEAKTGTKASRPEFQKMLAECENGNIDMIITKSISRFARNTVTLLETVRTLKQIGVDVYFEEQNIHSISGDGELMLTILASFAQEESLSVSENCKWRIRNDFKKGIPNSFMVFGFDIKNHQLSINESEAQVVKIIFSEYLNGLGKTAIANKLNDFGFRTKKDALWTAKKIDIILKNEKYVGDLLLQKAYSKDHISKQTMVNKGELPKYLVSDNHEPIIDRATFDEVQNQLHIRFQNYTPSNTTVAYPLTGKIVCGICGKNYRHKINNVGTKYANPVWICSTFNTRGKKHCPSKQIPESVLENIVNSFKKGIKQIITYPDNMLKFIFSDDTETQMQWQNKSRKWTDDMKAENYNNLRKGHKS